MRRVYLRLRLVTVANSRSLLREAIERLLTLYPLLRQPNPPPAHDFACRIAPGPTQARQTICSHRQPAQSCSDAALPPQPAPHADLQRQQTLAAQRIERRQHNGAAPQYRDASKADEGQLEAAQHALLLDGISRRAAVSTA